MPPATTDSESQAQGRADSAVIAGVRRLPFQDSGDAIFWNAVLSLLHWLQSSDVMPPSVSGFQGRLPIDSRGSYQGGSSQAATTGFSWLLASSYKWACLSTSVNTVPHRYVHVPTSQVILDFVRLTINQALGTGQLWYIIYV